MDDLEGAFEAVAYGVRVTGLPFAPWPQRGDPSSVSRSISWHSERAPVPGHLDGWSLGDAGSARIGWGAFADYRIDVGRTCTVAVRVDDISPTDAVLAFLLSVLPMSLPLFGLEPFHGSAVRGEDGALVFLSGRGGGKSSTASALNSLGYPLLTDDACALDADGLLWPGPPLLSPRDEQAEQRVVGQYNKKFLRSAGDIDANPVSIDRVFLLHPEPGRDTSVRRITAAEAFPAVIAQSRHPLFLADVRRDLQFRLAARLSTLGVDEVTYDPQACSFLDVAVEVTRSAGLGAA